MRSASRPGIGAAYDLSGTQKMVVRGNFGVFYDRPENNMTANQIGNPPNSTATTLGMRNCRRSGRPACRRARRRSC